LCIDFLSKVSHHKKMQVLLVLVSVSPTKNLTLSDISNHLNIIVNDNVS
jgi:hypothetical protein